MRKDYAIEEMLFTIRYSLESGTGELEASRYLNRHKVEIWTDEDMDEKPELAGKGEVIVILLSEAMNNEYDCYEIFDETSYLMDLGNVIFDFDTYDLKESLQDRLGGDIMKSDVCFISSLEILPKYRGIGLGKKVIKDVYHRFAGGCGLIVLKAFPKQFEGTISPFPQYKPTISPWRESLQLEFFEADEKKARKKLFDWYKSMGFNNVLRNEYFFINPAHKNEKMEAISFY